METFKLGDRITAEVIEKIEKDTMICSIKGNLFRVQNDSKWKYRPGDQIQLEVRSLGPLVLRIVDRKSESIDRLI